MRGLPDTAAPDFFATALLTDWGRSMMQIVALILVTTVLVACTAAGFVDIEDDRRDWWL